MSLFTVAIKILICVLSSDCVQNSCWNETVIFGVLKRERETEEDRDIKRERLRKIVNEQVSSVEIVRKFSKQRIVELYCCFVSTLSNGALSGCRKCEKGRFRGKVF